MKDKFLKLTKKPENKHAFSKEKGVEENKPQRMLINPGFVNCIEENPDFTRVYLPGNIFINVEEKFDDIVKAVEENVLSSNKK